MIVELTRIEEEIMKEVTEIQSESLQRIYSDSLNNSFYAWEMEKFGVTQDKILDYLPDSLIVFENYKKDVRNFGILKGIPLVLVKLILSEFVPRLVETVTKKVGIPHTEKSESEIRFSVLHICTKIWAIEDELKNINYN